MTFHQSRIAALVSAALLAATLGACGGDSPEKLIASGKDYLAKNDGNAAIIQLKNAIQQNPNHPEARFLLGKALFESGDIAGAEVELRKAFDQKYAPEQTVPLLAKVILATGQAKKVTDEFGDINLPSGEPAADLKTTLSIAYQAQGKQDKSSDELAAALSEKADYAPAQLANARIKASNKDMAGAAAIVSSVLGTNPKNHDALLLAGVLAAANGQPDEALIDFRRAIEAKPDFIAAHVAAINQLLQQQKLDDAIKQFDALKKLAPKHPQTLFLDAQLAYQRKDFKAARELAQQLIKFAPNNPLALQLAGAIEYQLQSFVQAETYLAKALQIAPQLPLARRILVASHLRAGQPAKALATLQPALEHIGQDTALLSLAGEVYLQNGDAGKAAEYFAKASKLDPSDAAKKTALALAQMAQGQVEMAFNQLEQIATTDKGTSADLALIAAHLRNNQIDKALQAIDALEKKQPDNPATFNLRARTLLAKNDIAGARAAFDKALSLNPSFFPAAASLATLDLADKKPDDARKRFDAVLAADPKHIQAMLALAELRANNGGTQDEVSGLINKAVTANPTEVAPRLALIQYWLQQKDNKKALTAANDAVAASPEKPEVLDALGRVQQISGDLNQALSTYGKLAGLQPMSPVPHLRLAEVHVANKNKEEAVKSLKKALEIKPNLIEAQRALILLAMDGKRTTEALSIAREVQKQRPKEAAGLVLEGDIHASQKNWNEAIASYRNALKTTPATELAVKTHNTILASGNAAEADKFAALWIKDHPKDITFRMHQGDLAMARKDYQIATQHYNAALALQPNNAMVLNNLAWALGEQKQAKALEYAEKANQLAPNQPAFMDTLAMLIAAKGDSGKAIEILRKAMTLAPQAAAIQLNLAKVLVSAGKKDEARKELEALAKLGEKFPEQDEVIRLQKAL